MVNACMLIAVEGNLVCCAVGIWCLRTVAGLGQVRSWRPSIDLLVRIQISERDSDIASSLRPSVRPRVRVRAGAKVVPALWVAVAPAGRPPRGKTESRRGPSEPQQSSSVSHRSGHPGLPAAVAPADADPSTLYACPSFTGNAHIARHAPSSERQLRALGRHVDLGNVNVGRPILEVRQLQRIVGRGC